jgi:hypothetical protein
MNLLTGFLYSVGFLVSSTIIYSVWVDKIQKRIKEMGRILTRIEDLHKKGELWKYQKEIPTERVDFLKKESYIYFAFGSIALALIGIGAYKTIELIQGGWFSIWDNINANPEGIRIKPKGYALIGLLRIYPIFALYILIRNGLSTITNIKAILPALYRYIKIDTEKVVGKQKG